MFCSAQERAIRTNYVKQKIDKTAQSPLCRMCHKKSETIFYIVSECENLAKKEYNKKSGKWGGGGGGGNCSKNLTGEKE